MVVKMLKRLRIYCLYLTKHSLMSLQSLLSTRLSSFLFLTGKLIRFTFFLWFLLILKTRLTLVSGYTFDQLVIFFLVFNLFDLLAQFFFRGIYWFRQDIITGTFDYKLIKPISPLFNALTKHTDFLDLPILILVIVMLIIKTFHFPSSNILYFLFLGLASFFTITAIHIIVAAIGVLTTEVDHTIWIFRDLASMGRVPVDIYLNFIRAFLTFVIPISLVFTIPAKVLLGLLTLPAIIASFFASIIVFYISIKFWQLALTKYSSASS